MGYGKWKIYWNEYSSGAYLYGSEIRYHENNRVEFKNELMPAGTIIKKWYSKTNFQMNRVEPSLPMIDGESRYRINMNVDSIPKNTVIIQLVFFDRYGNVAGTYTLREGEGEFKCPLKTYSYEMHLINAGAREVTFNSVTIQEIDNIDEGKEITKKTV